jgi:TM2 domain-containing membrane protein YozV
MFSEKELNLEEHELRDSIRALLASQRRRYDLQEARLLKRPSTYLRLNLLFPLGLHHFYLGRMIRGLMNLSLTLTALFLLLYTEFIAYGWMVLLATILLDIPQLMNARLLVHSRNNQIMAECLKRASQSGSRATASQPPDSLAEQKELS